MTNMNKYDEYNKTKKLYTGNERFNDKTGELEREIIILYNIIDDKFDCKAKWIYLNTYWENIKKTEDDEEKIWLGITIFCIVCLVLILLMIFPISICL